ncbi:MAG TPA: N-6 DNA methylase [Syntrophales bacterium]|nr:N-6 DNA methylase [Syntrophales bacterium]
MLDNGTKRRIDTARDILVGKVPDPKSQVEQITIALIYKFMDDMDAESEELGGSRKFFAGQFARYGWAKLMRSGLGGHETLNLYAEGIAKIPENPGIPLLFRDIFKNAYLPYRDPETLRAFLKVIDEFEYDHSERLGDAFEYLLSVLGSQGEAGQFRTPRHIIDFIVKIVDPKKNESILDPACGTAGFLISSYKHILRANADAKGNSTLTPDERGRLAKNLKGYDISPDMVRLSLVNMYLHGFADPHIYEYDTLTSQDKWNEYADAILANPPFMSPKGGIRPHNRFSVQSRRSEVLFVDYMAEHLTPNGRAGIIVPEGIIFKSQTAYKQLRKMLVEDYLVAVVSLPAGVFNPYSGVKTSILILDKSLVKRTDTIGFFKVENDGFDLGAQRRPIDKDDLPQVQAEIVEYLRRLRTGVSLEGFKPSLGMIVSRSKVTTNEEYNLGGERYRENKSTISAWPFVKVCDVFRKTDSTILPESLDGPVTYLGLENITQNTGHITDNVLVDQPSEIKSLKNVFKSHDILYGKLRPNLNKVWLADRKGICSTDIFVIETLGKKVISSLYAYIFRSPRFNDMVMSQLKGAQLPRIGWSSFAEIQIPLPSLETQKEIVAEIEGYQKVIDGARAIIDNYRPHIPIDPEWPMVRLADVCETITDGDHQPPPKASQGVPFVTITNINDDHQLDFTKTFFVPESYYDSLSATRKPRAGDVLYTVTGSYGIPVLVQPNIKFCFQRHIALIRTGPQLLNTFLRYLLALPFMLQQGHAAATGVAQKTVSLNSLRNFSIPLPPLDTQKAIVAEIETEEALVKANHELISRFEKKIQATISRVWGEDKPA